MRVDESRQEHHAPAGDRLRIRGRHHLPMAAIRHHAQNIGTGISPSAGPS
jgi:hypothetical protein